MPVRLIAAAAAVAYLAIETWAGDSVLLDDFEHGLSGWQSSEGKQPLLLSDAHVRHGRQAAYSGPPGNMRVGRRAFLPPLTGRTELSFYDDLAPVKHQMAGTTGPDGEILGIVCHGGTHYETRIGKKYTATAVKRSEGWHRFAWECDGSRTIAYIDGVQVAVNPQQRRITGLFIGSFWDASTGWYDDIRVERRPPAAAGAFVEAEECIRQSAPAGTELEIEEKDGASGRAVVRWHTAGHELTWLVDSTLSGPAALLLKYAAAQPAKIRLMSSTGLPSRSLPASPAGAGWTFASLPVTLAGGRQELTLCPDPGSLDLDWLAVVPADTDAASYGPLLDQWPVQTVWSEAAWRLTEAAATAAGVDISDARPHHRGLVHQLPNAEQLREWSTGDAGALTAARARILTRLTPQLKSRFHVQPWSLPARETPLSQEYYHRLRRYLQLTAPRFRDWPHAPDCRYHKREGHQEWDVRQNATVALGYATLLRGATNGAALPDRDRIAADLAALLRTIAITHKANFLPTSDGQPWGDQWQSAFWAGIAGEAGWLVWSDLPEDVQLMLARMVEHEANRFNHRPPDSGIRYDTKAEENAWNSEIIALAACMFAQHPEADRWRERAIVYMLNSFVREADRRSPRLIDGKPVSERLCAVTIHPDFTLENHHRVHPDYLSTGSLMLRNSLLYAAAGQPLPESMFFNVRETYDVLKRLIALNGSCFYVNGQDWWPHRHGVPLLISGFMSVLARDAEAAFVERQTLDFIGRMHARFADGSAWDAREYNYANAEEELLARYAELYLAHRHFGDGPPPASRQAYLQAQSGLHEYLAGGFVTHRTPHKFVSFAWKDRPMGLVVPGDDTWLVSPYERGIVGSIACRGRRDDPPRLRARRMSPVDSGMAVAVALSRCEGAVEQRLAFVSLPEGPVICLERLVALADVEVTQVATGTIGILNEDAPGISPNRRRLYVASGTEDIPGTGGDERTLKLPTAWLNVDDRLGVVATASGMAYEDRNRYRRGRLEELLIPLWTENVTQASAGTQVAARGLAILPGFTAQQTAAYTVFFTAGADGLLNLMLPDGTSIRANLGDTPVAITRAPGSELAPLEIVVTETAPE